MRCAGLSRPEEMCGGWMYVAILHLDNIRCCVWNRLWCLAGRQLLNCFPSSDLFLWPCSSITLLFLLTSLSLSGSGCFSPLAVILSVTGQWWRIWSLKPVSLCLALTFSLSISLYLYIYYTISLSWWSTIFDLNWYIFIYIKNIQNCLQTNFFKEW